MASNPPAQCCTIGFRHDGKPEGKSLKVGKWDAYLATPPTGMEHEAVGLLYIPDVTGTWQNSQLLADQFAANGYKTLMLDIFNGDPVSLHRPADFDFMGWIAKGSTGDNPHTPPAVDPIVEAGIQWFKDQGVTKLGAVGYCFGAKYVARHYKNGIKVGFFAHPSFVDEDELRSITGPLSIAAAETDHIFSTEKRHRSEEILKEVNQPWQINLYSGVEHGFAVRADLSKKKEKFAKEQAFFQAVTWFNEHLL